ncbi:MAG: HD domain-containing protein [Deltaproteobacteria bacterium]|nr:HD domain-containing protein [Deltaproteobacteria bacterium]
MSEKKRPRAARVLVVDGDADVLSELTNILAAEGHRVQSFRDGSSAIRGAWDAPPDLVICGVAMPGLSGFQIYDIFRADESLRDIPIVFLAEDARMRAKIRESSLDGVGFLPKPLRPEVVLAEVDIYLKSGGLRRRISNYDRLLEESVEEQVKKVSDAHMATIVALAKLAECRDDDTGQHIERTRTFCRLLAEQLSATRRFEKEIDRAFIDNIFFAGALHDIGKVAIADAILLKPGKLNEDEFAEMKRHTIYGASTLQEVDRAYPANPFIKMGIAVAKHHHERWDGTGYPDRLAGRRIPLAARIMSVADVYDALRSRRPYKDALPHATCRRMIVDGRETQFDLFVVEAFQQVEQEFARISIEMGPGDRVGS